MEFFAGDEALAVIPKTDQSVDAEFVLLMEEFNNNMAARQRMAGAKLRGKGSTAAAGAGGSRPCLGSPDACSSAFGAGGTPSSMKGLLAGPLLADDIIHQHGRAAATATAEQPPTALDYYFVLLEYHPSSEPTQRHNLADGGS